MFDRMFIIFLLGLLFLSLSGLTMLENAFGQVTVSGEPSGSRILQHGELFEVGLRMKTGTSINYMLRSDSFLYFDIHSHDGTQITTLSTTEGKSFEGQFVAPKDADYYFLAENLGESDITLTYSISFVENNHPVVYDGIRYDVITYSNSNIDFLGFSQEDKQILIILKTPYLTPGFVNVSIPRTLIDGPFDVQGTITKYNYTQNESSSTFTINTSNGTNDISIVGTTVVPEFPFPIVLLFLALSSFILYVRLRSLPFSMHLRK